MRFMIHLKQPHHGKRPAAPKTRNGKTNVPSSAIMCLQVQDLDYGQSSKPYLYWCTVFAIEILSSLPGESAQGLELDEEEWHARGIVK